jgi:hypothetical protein
MQRIPQCTWISIICQQMLQHWYECASQYLIFRHSNSITPHLTLLPNGIGKYAGLVCHHKTHDRSWGFPGVPESGWIMHLFHCFDFEMRTWPQDTSAPHICNGPMIRNPLLHHPQYSPYAIYCEIAQPGTCSVAYQLTSSHICHY